MTRGAQKWIEVMLVVPSCSPVHKKGVARQIWVALRNVSKAHGSRYRQRQHWQLATLCDWVRPGSENGRSCRLAGYTCLVIKQMEPMPVPNNVMENSNWNKLCLHSMHRALHLQKAVTHLQGYLNVKREAIKWCILSDWEDFQGTWWVLYSGWGWHCYRDWPFFKHSAFT